MKLRGKIEITINGEVVLSSEDIIIENEGEDEVELIVTHPDTGREFIVQVPRT